MPCCCVLLLLLVCAAPPPAEPPLLPALAAGCLVADRFGDLLMAVIFSLLAWRCAVAATSAKENMGASMLLGFPDWIVLASMSLPVAMAAIIAFAQAASKFNSTLEEAS